MARLAAVGLRTRKLRAGLSALGIAIGVAAITAVLGLSASSQAGLLAEIARLGGALGADQHTFAGLAGLGDLVASCSSPLARNRSFGEKLGQGVPLARLLASTTQAVEGVKSSLAVRQLARDHGVAAAETRAAVSLAGPLAGFFVAVACAALWWQTGNPLWSALARTGAILNLLNLIPVWVLDGGQAVLALSKTERIILLTACLALWLVLKENMFFLVAIGAGYQAFFAGGLPAHPSRSTTIYFLAVLTALGVIIRLMPGTGFGVQ